MGIVRFNRTSFLRMLEVGGQCVGDNKKRPMFKQVRIIIKEGKAKVESNNDFSNVRAFGDCLSSDANFAFCVGFKELFSYCKAISADELTITLKEGHITIEHEDGETTLPCYPAEDFPEASKPGSNLPQYKIDGAVFRAWISSSKNFVANDDLHPNLNGINIVAKEGHIHYAATDAHSLIYEEIDFEPQADFDFIIDAKAFPALLSIIHDCEIVTLSVSDTAVFISVPSAKVSIRRTIGKFPNVKGVLPKTFVSRATISKDKLDEAIKRIKVSASNIGTKIKFCFNENTLTLVFEDLISNRLGKELLEIKYSGVPFDIAFNVGNIGKCVSAIDSKNIDMWMTTPSKPALLLDADKNCGMCTLLTPVIFNTPAPTKKE